MSSQTPTYLLDKSVVRKAITGIARAELGQSLTKEEVDCLSLLQKAKRRNLRLFVSVETSNILRRFSRKPEVQTFLAYVEVMQAGRYFKRWTRRLHEHGFTREDAKILGLHLALMKLARSWAYRLSLPLISLSSTTTRLA